MAKERQAVLTASRAVETCRTCGNPIPAWQDHVLSWIGRAEAVRREHQDCSDERPAGPIPQPKGE